MKYLPTKPYRGTRDFLPDEMSIRTQMFENLFRTVELFGFRRYDGPILEPAAIYEAKSGGEIANEQMYRLQDKKGRELALRPEMTPSIARIIAGNQNQIVFPSRWYSHVNCHRYERPQRGRVREHWQLNVDLFGSEDVEAELEIFDLITSLMRNLGATDSMYAIRVNDRTLIDAALRRFVEVPDIKLSEVGLVIDRWEKVTEEKRHASMAAIGLNANQVDRLSTLITGDLDAMCDAAGPEATERSRVAKLIRTGAAPDSVRYDPVIMRGFDYYTSTVFEVFDTSPENRRSMFGGGRYDDLAGLFTDRRIPGIGFGMGDVTCWNFLETHGLLPEANLGPDVYVFATNEAYRNAARRVAHSLRTAGIRAAQALETPSMSVGVRTAHRLGARYATIIGDIEHEASSVSLKDMLTSEQNLISENDLVQTIRSEMK